MNDGGFAAPNQWPNQRDDRQKHRYIIQFSTVVRGFWPLRNRLASDPPGSSKLANGSECTGLLK
jgi:hypothetical protein